MFLEENKDLWQNILLSKYLLQSSKNPSKIVLIAIHKLITSRLGWMSTHEAPHVTIEQTALWPLIHKHMDCLAQPFTIQVDCYENGNQNSSWA